MIKSEIDGVYRMFPTEFRKVALKHLRGNDQLVDDAMQETLCRAASKQDKFDPRYGRRGLHAWLLAILRIVCLEMLRKPPVTIVDRDWFDEDNHPDPKGTEDFAEVLCAAESEENRHLLRKVIAHARMSDLEWACVTASLAGVPSADIAADLGMKPRTVGAHVRNVLPRLRAAAIAHDIAFS